MKAENSKILKTLFNKFQWIPQYLSKSIFSENKISYEKQDILQDMNMRLWLALKTYYNLCKKNKKPRTNIGAFIHRYCINYKKRFIYDIAKNSKIKIHYDEYDIGTFENVKIEIKFENEMSIYIDNTNILNIDISNLDRNIFKDFISGYKYNEIAKIYNLSMPNVRNRIFSVRNKIKENFSDYKFDDKDYLTSYERIEYFDN